MDIGFNSRGGVPTTHVTRFGPDLHWPNKAFSFFPSHRNGAAPAWKKAKSAVIRYRRHRLSHAPSSSPGTAARQHSSCVCSLSPLIRLSFLESQLAMGAQGLTASVEMAPASTFDSVVIVTCRCRSRPRPPEARRGAISSFLHSLFIFSLFVLLISLILVALSCCWKLNPRRSE
ncbi:hypothetical protein REPUB_Repub11eG0145800 [Reevesia pubescens]